MPKTNVVQENLEWFLKDAQTKYGIYYKGKIIFMDRGKNFYKSPGTARMALIFQTRGNKAAIDSLIADGSLEFKLIHDDNTL